MKMMVKDSIVTGLVLSAFLVGAGVLVREVKAPWPRQQAGIEMTESGATAVADNREDDGEPVAAVTYRITEKPCPDR